MNRSAIVSIAIYLLSKKRLKDIHARFIYFCDTSAPVTSFPCRVCLAGEEGAGLSSQGVPLFLMPFSHRCSGTWCYSRHHSTTCVHVFQADEAARSPLHSLCIPSRLADLHPRNWTQSEEGGEIMMPHTVMTSFCLDLFLPLICLYFFLLHFSYVGVDL